MDFKGIGTSVGMKPKKKRVGGLMSKSGMHADGGASVRKRWNERMMGRGKMKMKSAFGSDTQGNEPQVSLGQMAHQPPSESAMASGNGPIAGMMPKMKKQGPTNRIW